MKCSIETIITWHAFPLNVFVLFKVFVCYTQQLGQKFVYKHKLCLKYLSISVLNVLKLCSIMNMFTFVTSWIIDKMDLKFAGQSNSWLPVFGN